MNGGTEAFGFGRAGDTPPRRLRWPWRPGGRRPCLCDVRQDHRQL